jgi:hypothetical protein
MEVRKIQDQVSSRVQFLVRVLFLAYRCHLLTVSSHCVHTQKMREMTEMEMEGGRRGKEMR